MTRQINVGNVKIGGGAPISVQSMTNTDTKDAVETLSQIERLHKAGCDIIRVTVPDTDAAEAMKEICAKSPFPLLRISILTINLHLPPLMQVYQR